MSDFVHQIEDNDFKVTKELFEATMLRVNRGTTTLNLLEFYDNVESRQRTLDKAADNDMKVRSRRSNVQRSRKRGYSPASSVESRSSGGHSNPSNNAFKNTNLKLPNAIFKELSESQQKAVVKWRNDLKNGREVDNDAIKKLLGQESSGRNESKKEVKESEEKKEESLGEQIEPRY